MITVQQYFAQKENHVERTPEMDTNASNLLERVNALVEEAIDIGAFDEEIDPDTGSTISGSRGGDGDGGFRLSTSKTGGPKSAHRKARGVDKYDPHDNLDKWLDLYEEKDGKNSKLKQYGLYREAPHATPGWCHLQDIPPGSGRQTFNP